MKRGPSIRLLLFGVNAVVLLAPIVAIVGLRFYDTLLVHQTERRLISEAVLIGEAYRAALLEEEGRGADADVSIAPPNRRQKTQYYPIDPRLDMSEDVVPPAPAPTRFVGERDGPEWRAGRRIKPLLDRAKRVNLSGARVLDPEGCVVASTGAQLGACIDRAPEVRRALRGKYGAVLRERWSDEPPPPITSISRRGRVRVFTAVPIFHDGEVLAVVRMSRTGLDSLKALWLQRRTISIGLAACVLLTILMSLYLSRLISRPVRAITYAATAVARGQPDEPLRPAGLVPQEVFELGAALDQMTHQLTDRANYIAEFAANVSHELKTPITGIRGAAELLRDQWEEMSPEQRRRFVDNIDGDAARMERLVGRLLELARIQNAPEHPDAVELASFFQTLAERYAERVSFDTEEAPASITINPDHLRAAVGNLIDNALDHGRPPVEVAVRERDGRLEVSVTDHGEGISENNRKKVFERFFTTSRDAGGTGLGLAIVAAVSEARDGTIELQSGSNGTTFVLTI